MTSFSKLMDPMRIERIGSVMPELNSFVQKSDVLLMGLDNDSLFPYENGERPMCKVLDVRNDASGTELDVKNMSTGDVFTIPKNSVTPEHLWQFEAKSFQDVIDRQMAMADAEASGASGAAAVDDVSPMSDDLPSKVAFLEQVIGQMAADMSERQVFDMNVTRALDRLSKDVMRVSSSKTPKFAPAFHGEYAAALSDASSSSDSASESELSFSESESEMSESEMSESEMSESEMSESSASESSDGSSFAATLLKD
jgi:hypothetical protein